MEPEHEMIDVGRHVGGEAADHIARRAEDYCEYERQRIELANEARINALHVEGARLTKCVCQLEERLRLMTNGQVLIAGGISDAGETLGSADLYDTLSGSGANLSKLLVSPRHDQTATLLPDGTVQLWGGLGPSGISIDFGEVFDPTTSSFRLETTPFQFQSSESPALEASIPENNSENVASNTLIALRFSKPLQVSTVNSQTVALADSSGTAIACQVVPAEGGILAFITPQSSLLPGTTYTITVNGASDVNGIVLPATSISFTTSQPPPKSEPTSPSNDFWTPLAANFQPGHWRSGNGSSPNQLMPALHAAPGVTALAGQTLRLNGEPLREVTVSIGSEKTITDETGRFLLPGLPAGHQVLLVDGTTASRQGVTYCIFQVGVDVTAGKTNVLNYTIWMTAIDKAHEISIPSPTTTDTVVSTPLLPGLELHIPPNTVIRDRNGKAVTRISITPVPVDQPPFPLPAGVTVPIYFTIQPGDAYIDSSTGSWVKGARLFYPNMSHARTGTTFDFWNYDPGAKGWYVYGQGTVGADSQQIVPNPGVEIYEFTGAMVGAPTDRPSTFPPPGGKKDGDPVDLSSGLFEYQKTDLALQDVIPVALTRTYRPADATSRAFGVGASHPYDIFLVGDRTDYPNWTYFELVLPNGAPIRYNVANGLTGLSSVFVHSSTATMYYGSTISWNGTGWSLKLKDGTTYLFPEASASTRAQQAALIGIVDRYGNKLQLTRDSNDNLTQILTPNGRFINFTYDSSYRITQAQDNIGRTVSYAYDSGGRLSSVTDANGGTTTYTYDGNNDMLTITDPRGITYLTNHYDANSRVTSQTLADGSTYQFAYTLSSNTSQLHSYSEATGYTGGGPAIDIIGFRGCSGCYEGYTPEVSQVNVTDPNGNVRQVVIGTTGYVTSDTHALGKTEQQTVTYQYFPDNLLESTTDALSRTTAYTYDATANTTEVTRLSGTGGAVSTSFTYESTFSQLTSVSDPLSHTTSFGHDSNGNLISVTDPLSNQTTFTYNIQGQPLTATDSLGDTTTFTYTAGDLASITDPLSRTTSRFVDEAGRLGAVTDPLGNSTKYVYDALNDTTSVTDPLGNITSFTYDGNGDLLSVTDVNGHQTTYTYNSMDRLATRTDPLSNTEIYYYDGNGNLTQFADRRGKVTQYAYDGLNRRTLAKFGMTLGLTPYESSIAYNYDAGNRLTSAVDSIAGTITPTFDSLDRLTEEATPQGSISYAYDAASRRTTQTVAGQTEVAYTYDNANRLTQITQGTPTVSLAYDDANRRTSLTLPNGVVVSYGYDAGSQLTGLTYTNGGTTLGNLTYSYDLAGRRTSVGGSLAAVNFPIGVGSASYNADNRLTQWGTANLYYDANGNMTSDGINSYVWDGRNHLASMDSAIISFQYDGYGRRSGKTISGTSTNYLYDGANAVQELSGTTPTANLLMGSTDEYFTRTDSSGTANFLTDAVGSTVALTNSSGSALASYVYEPFGNATLASGSSANPYQYTGRENDGTGLYYYRARYYAPTLGRFISEDPIGFNGGGANLYAYAGNSPTNLRDPSGQNPCLILGLLGTMVYNSHVIYNSLAGRKVVYYSGWSGFGHILAGNAAAFGAGCSLGFGFGAFGAGGAAGTAAGIGAGYGLAGQATSDALSGNFSGVNTYAGAAAGGAIGGMAFEADPAIAGAVAGSVSDLTTQGLDDISTGAGGLQVVPIMSKGVIGGFAGGMFPDSVVPGEGSLGAFDSGLRGAVAGGVFDAAQRMANGN